MTAGVSEKTLSFKIQKKLTSCSFKLFIRIIHSPLFESQEAKIEKVSVDLFGLIS